MRQFFEPAGAPIWLGTVLRSVRNALSDIWDTPLKLKDYKTGDLPRAADWGQGLVYDSSLPTVRFSNGAQWLRLSEYDEDVAAIGDLTTTGLIARTGDGTAATRTITGPAAGITVANGDGVSGNPTLALANDLAALEGLTGTNTIPYRSAADTWAGVTIGANLTFSAGTLSASDGTGYRPLVNGDNPPVFIINSDNDLIMGEI